MGEVREHHAPVGALRLRREEVDELNRLVREHHAPVGALRREVVGEPLELDGVREHHAPVGALRRVIANAYAASVMLSGSTTHL